MTSMHNPAKPVPVVGVSTIPPAHGRAGKTTWARKFQRVMGRGFTERGHRNSQGGAVLDIYLRPGQVIAVVNDTRPRQVIIEFVPCSAQEWQAVVDTVAEITPLANDVVAGEGADSLERVFDLLGLDLFPERYRHDFVWDCSCYNYSLPCQHIAAVMYLVAQHLDTSPFDLLLLRGMTHRELKGAVTNAVRARASEATAPDEPAHGVRVTSLGADLEGFYGPPDGAMQEFTVTGRPPQEDDSHRWVFDRFPPVSVPVRGVPLMRALEPAYEH